MDTLFKAYMKTATEINNYIKKLKEEKNNTRNLEIVNSLNRRITTLYDEYLDLLYSAKLIKEYYSEKKPSASIADKIKEGQREWKTLVQIREYLLICCQTLS